jgi:uncharacterized protein (DUF2062 family)
LSDSIRHYQPLFSEDFCALLAQIAISLIIFILTSWAFSDYQKKKKKSDDILVQEALEKPF